MIGRRATRALLAGLVVALCGPLALQQVAYAKPHMPTDNQIRKARQQVAQRAAAVGRLSAAVARKDAQIGQLRDLAELAMERYDKARVDLAAATAAQRRTAAAARSAQLAVRSAQAAAGRFVRASYVEGTALTSWTTLLSAQGPGQLLQQAEFLRYGSAHQLDVLGAVRRATVRKANADSAARAAVLARTAAAHRAERAKVEAQTRVATAHAQLRVLTDQRTSLQRQLTAARVRADGLVAERRRYDAWRRAVLAERARARARAAARSAALAAAASWTGGGSGWSAAKGRYVAHAALRWLGTRYAWGGGNYAGPTYGVDGPDDGWNDGSVFGFDCSGLAMWAWARAGVYLPHYSGYQYYQGSHPSVSALLPGDLVFWSYDGTAAGIHHVAVYLGGGMIVQAPQSGDVVRISTMWFDGYLGATRPGT